MKQIAVACAVLLAGCANVPTPSQVEQARAACACTPTPTMSSRSNCEQIMAMIFNGVNRNLGGRGPVNAAQASLRPLSVYGPTDQGWKGMSHGRVDGDTSLKGDADTAMLALQTLDAVSQLQSRAPTRSEVIATAMGEPLRDEGAVTTRERYLAPLRSLKSSS